MRRSSARIRPRCDGPAAHRRSIAPLTFTPGKFGSAGSAISTVLTLVKTLAATSVGTSCVKVIFTWPPLSLRRNATEILVIRKPPSLGPPFGRQTSCCPFCTVSFRLPVFAAISNTAGCSSVANPSASLGRLGVCARTGNAMQVENPMSAARRVTLMVIPVAPKRLARCRPTHVPKTLPEKLNCALPSLPARGQRCSQAARTIDACGDGASVASHYHRRWLATRARPSSRS